MNIRKSIRSYHGRTYTNYVLVESVHTPKGPRQKTICSLERIAQRRLVKPVKINQAIGRLKERYPRVARYFDLSYDPHTATLAAPFNADKHVNHGRDHMAVL
jgi:hypothetical protein